MNKVAFITGASRGIGREAALAFARAGFDLAISACTLNEGEHHEHALRDANGAAGRQPQRHCPGVARTRLPGSRGADGPARQRSALDACEAVLAEYGRIDVLINNAIYQGSDLNAGFMDLQAQTLERMFKGYILTPFLLTRAVAEHGDARRRSGDQRHLGRRRKRPPVAGKGLGHAYGAGKAAVSRLSGVLATEWGSWRPCLHLNPG
jgi:NAD(P)-dependent dehydrogenase (short-subunit alcohol dehydrogenase family)